MISHFSWKPLFPKEKLPGWKISFYYKGTHYEGIYHKSGEIEWGDLFLHLVSIDLNINGLCSLYHCSRTSLKRP